MYKGLIFEKKLQSHHILGEKKKVAIFIWQILGGCHNKVESLKNFYFVG